VDSQAGWIARYGFYGAVSAALVEILIRWSDQASGVGIGHERGPIEALHLSLQGASLLFFSSAALRSVAWPRACALAAFAAALGLLREADSFLDQMLFKGAYKFPAAAVGVAALLHVWLARRTLLAELREWSETRSFLLASIGAFVVLVYAQVAGQKELWQEMMGPNYMRPVKDAVEEIVELLGYLLIFFASVETYLSARWSDARSSG
jgi:hypothetical protein